MIKYVQIISISISLAIGFSSCSVLGEYDKIYLYDPDMRLNPMQNEFYEISVQTYREGSTEANSGKNGGGCGCY